MWKRILIVILQLLFSFAQQNCTNYWDYIRDQNQIQGLLTFVHNKNVQQHEINVVLSIGSVLQNSYVGEIRLTKDKTSALYDIKNEIPLQYKIKFPIKSPLPKLQAVFYNDRAVCTGSTENAKQVATIVLNHKFDSRATQNNLQNNLNSPNQQNLKSFVQKQTATQSPSIRLPLKQTTSKYYNYQNLNNQCGVPDQVYIKHASLIIKGNPARKGQFPWLVSYFFNGVDVKAFICGGSLISSTSVLTAANCIREKQSLSERSAEESYFYIGKHNLNANSREHDYSVISVYKFLVHPKWDPFIESYNADIAIAKLSRPAIFSRSIKPICLWSKTSSYHDIVDQNGVIAGYGKTTALAETASSIPFWAVLSAVDEGKCLRSNPAYSVLTSQNSFCIGNQDGTGPCNGDSGGGFMIERNGVWYLRGIVVASIFDPILSTCDTKSYAICTDVSAYYNWITQNM